jgi:hypothetical protein
MVSQELRGLVGQGMNGRRARRTPETRIYSRGSYTFTADEAGWYRFVLWGGGAGANNGVVAGGSGALVIAERLLNIGQIASITVGRGGPNNPTGSYAGSNSTVTLPGGEVLTAGGAVSGTGGSASANTSRGDIATNGTTTAVTGNGMSAPSFGDYQGGAGATDGGGFSLAGACPGGGGRTDGGVGSYGGDGLVIVVQVRVKS